MPKHICPKCGSALPDGAETCSVCGADVRPASTPANAARRRTAAITLAIGLVTVAVLVGLRLFSHDGERYGEGYAFYSRDYQIYYTDFTRGGDIQLTRDLYLGKDDGYYSVYHLLSNEVTVTEDLSRVFFPDYSTKTPTIDLYCRDLDPLSDAVLVGEDIVEYFVNPDGTKVVYLSGNTDENGNIDYDSTSLYWYDLESGVKTHIADGVWDMQASSGLSSVAYFKRGSTLFVWDSETGASTRLSTGVSRFAYISDDLSEFYYISDDLSAQYHTEDTLLRLTAGGESEIVDFAVAAFIEQYDGGSMYYLTLQTDTRPLSDFVIDDMADADAALTPPEDSDGSDGSDGSDASEAYAQKEERDKLRIQLGSVTFSIPYYSLYYYDGEKSVLVSDRLPGDSIISSDSREAMLYRVYRNTDFERVNLSEITSVYQLRTMVNDAVFSEYDQMLALGSESFPLDSGVGVTYAFSQSGDTLFYVDTPGVSSTGELYRIDISGGEPGEAEFVDDGVNSGKMFAFSTSGMAYFKNVSSDGESGDMYADGREIARGVECRYSTYGEGDTLFCQYLDEKRTFCIYRDGALEHVADGIYSYNLLPSGELAYTVFTDPKAGKYELRLYSGGASEKIAGSANLFRPRFPESARRGHFMRWQIISEYSYR